MFTPPASPPTCPGYRFVLPLEPRLGSHQHSENSPPGNFGLVLAVQSL